MLLLLLACTASKDATTDDSAINTDDSNTNTDDSNTDDSGSNTGALSFENCQATVGSDVPDFYKKYFACTDISVDGDTVVLYTDSLPPYSTYYYGQGSEGYTEWDDSSGDTFPNPNLLSAQSFTVRISANPVSKGLNITSALVDHEANTSDEEYHGSPQGGSSDSVAMFHGVAAPGDDILEEEYTFDQWGSHPTNTGAYHHHGANAGSEAAMAFLGITVDFYGIMCDGTVLLGCNELDGTSVSGSLDAQAGHTGTIKDSETTYFTDRYHIHLCDANGNYSLAPEIQYYQDCGSPPPM